MALDETMEKILLERNNKVRPTSHELSPVQAREQEKSGDSTPNPTNKYTVTDHLVPGLDGHLTARIYTPMGVGPFPILIWFHGGGWVTGDLELSQTTPINLCLQAGYIVASVGYRLAPETKFPGPVEDCYAAANWIRDNAITLNGIRTKVCIGGSSSGGNLAAAVCLMTRDRGKQQFSFQLLIYPVLSSNTETESYRLYSSGYGLEKQSMDWFIRHYLNDEQDLLNPYAMPLNSPILEGLCPAMIITAECDPLRDEGAAYARRLQESGTPAEYICYPGMIHGFFSMTNISNQSRNQTFHLMEQLHLKLEYYF